MEKLNIISVESKSGARGSFVRANTNKGWYSAFEEPAMGLLLQSVGKELNCETQAKQSGDKTYNNIVGAEMIDTRTSSLAPGSPIQSIPMKEAMPADTPRPVADDKREMYVSYTKDIFKTIIESTPDGTLNQIEMMAEAIALVKQARDAF